MKHTDITLAALRKWTDVPKLVNELEDETWFVAIDDRPVGVGIFRENSDACIMAIIGDSEADQRLLGSAPTDSDADDALVRHGLEIAYIAYLRSIKGDHI